MARINYLLAGLVGLLVGESYLLLASGRFDLGVYLKAARAISQGSNPYGDFGYRQLPFSSASPFWLGLSIAALAASVVLTFAAFGWPLDRLRLLWLLACLASPPSLITLFFGAATPFVLLGYSAALLLARHDRYALAGFALAAAMIKPNLALIVAPSLLAMPFSAWAGFTFGVALWIGLSAIVAGPSSLLAFAGRIFDLGTTVLPEVRPTLFGLLADYWPQPTLVNLLFAGVLLALLLWLFFARLAERSFPFRSNEMTVLAMLLLPYVKAVDLILLLPVYLAVMKAGTPQHWCLTGLVLIWTLPLLTMFLTTSGSVVSLDSLILIVLLVAMRRQTKPGGRYGVMVSRPINVAEPE